jgi:hypothetical protein
MKGRLIASAVLLALCFTFNYVYDAYRGPVEGAVAAKQLQNDDAAYGASRTVVVGDVVVKVVNWGTFGLIGLIWLTALFGRKRDDDTAGTTGLLLVFVLSPFAQGCMGPPKLELIQEIGTSETAFLVPLEGNTKDNQGKFDSIEYLEAKKLAAKRVSLPQRKLDTGRGWWAYKYIPTARVIKVDRSPVTREWTDAKTNGTSPKNEAIYVESKDSIGFGIGVNITASIEEENTARYLYHYPSGRGLAEVMDTNVRGVVTSYLSSEFGKCQLEKCRELKVDIFQGLKQHLVQYFKTFGITIRSVGYAQGMMYDNKEIQQAVDETFKAELMKKVAEQKKLAQIETNLMEVSIAVAKKEQAQEFAKAAEAQKAMIDLEIRKMEAEARLIAARKWNGTVPSQVLPQGSQFLFGLDKSK